MRRPGLYLVLVCLGIENGRAPKGAFWFNLLNLPVPLTHRVAAAIPLSCVSVVSTVIIRTADIAVAFRFASDLVLHVLSIINVRALGECKHGMNTRLEVQDDILPVLAEVTKGLYRRGIEGGKGNISKRREESEMRREKGDAMRACDDLIAGESPDKGRIILKKRWKK
jgi:hypothetical protein